MTSRGEHIRLDKGSIVKHHYEVVTSVGSGNFSKVYRVIDLQLPPKEQKRKPLAMKVIKKEYSSDAKYEKQMLIALHKNDKNHCARVSKMYECFVFQDCPVFIMPIHGPSIRSRRLGINRGVVTREKLLEFAFDILETMDFVHFQCHMVHTDLKPENILIADSNVPENSMGDEWVVCDFGSASLWRMDKLDSDLISTRPYRAPEVVLGNKWHYAADIWSVGCILYEVAVGHRLFEIRDDLTHLHMMDRRVGKLPEAFTKSSKYASKFFNSRGEFLSTPDVIRFNKCRLTSIRDMFRDDREFLHLLEGLLVYDPSRRMTATEALALPMFDEIRAARERRLQREAEETEARRQRRRAAAAAAAGGTAATTNTGSDSLMSTVNSLMGTLTVKAADRAAEDGRKVAGSTPPSVDDVTAAAAKAAAQSTAPRSSTTTAAAVAPASATATGADAAPEEPRDGQTPLTGRSAAETTTSRVSLQVSPGKEAGKARSSRSNTGSASPPKSGKTRARAVSTPAALTKSTSGNTAAVATGANLNASTVSTSASAGNFVTKDVPSHRPVVDSHRASTGSMATAANTTVVPKLALNRLTGNDSITTTSTSGVMAAASTTAKAPRTAGSSGSGSAQAGRKSGLRTASPVAKAKSTVSSSSHTPRKAGRTSRRESGSSADDAAAAASGETTKRTATAAEAQPVVTPHTPDTAAAGPAGLTRNTCSVTPTPPHDVAAFAAAAARKTTPPPQLPQQGLSAVGVPSAGAAASPLVDGNRSAAQAAATHTTPVALPTGGSVLSTVPVSASGRAAVTPLRLSSTATPVGHQSPLERGATAVGITTRTELPVDIRSPPRDGEGEDGSVDRLGEEEEEEEDGERRARETATDASEKDGDDESSEANHRHDKGHNDDDDDASSLSGDAGEATDASNFPSPGATNPDGSPRATDYRSPARRRPPVVTPTDDISGPTTPDATRRSAMYGSASSGEWASMEAAAAVPALAFGPTLATTTAATKAVVSARTVEKGHGHPFPQAQPAPNLALNSPRSDGHRTPREVSPAPITGRANSPITTARRSSQPQLQPQQAVADGAASATGRDRDGHDLSSTVPIVRGNSRSGSLVSTAISSPNPDALARTIGPNSSTASAAGAAAALAPAHDGASTSSASPAHGAGTVSGGSAYPVILRSPHGGGSLTPRASTAGTRSSIHAAGAASGAPSLAATTPASGTIVTTTGGVSPSMKPVINITASMDRLKAMPPSNIADIRGPSAIPVCASRRTVVKPGPSALSNSGSTSSGIPEHPITPLPSAPHASATVPHLPEAVARSRERSLVADASAAAAAAAAAASRRGSANSPNLALSAAADASTPRTPLPSTSAAGGATGTTSLSSSVSLPSTSAHPTLGVVRQRSGSTHLLPGHPSTASGLESNPTLPTSQLGMYTPRGTRVLQEHQAGVSGRSSATLPSVLPGGNSSAAGAAATTHHHSAAAPTSPPPPSHGSRTSLSLASPGVAVADTDVTSSRCTEHVNSQPTTPRGSGRASVKSLDLQQLHHPTTTKTTAASGAGGTRPPRSSISNAGPSPIAPSGGSGGKSPRYSSKTGGASSGHTAQAALNASTGSLHLGVTRSPRKPVAPGANTGAANNGSPSLMASMDSVSAVSLRSPRSSSRVTTSPRGSGSRKDTAKAVSPRRAPLSPRAKPSSATTNGSASAATESSSAPAAAAVSHTTATDAGGVALSVPMQPLQQQAQPTPVQPAPGARLSQLRRTITVISSKPSSSAQLSRYSNVAAVAPTRTSAQRPPPSTDLLASTGKLPASNGLNTSYKQSSAVPATATSASITPISGLHSRQSSTADASNSNINNAETGSASGSTGPKYKRDARTLKRIIVQRPSPQSSGASMVSPQELGDEDASSTSPSASMN